MSLLRAVRPRQAFFDSLTELVDRGSVSLVDGHGTLHRAYLLRPAQHHLGLIAVGVRQEEEVSPASDVASEVGRATS